MATAVPPRSDTLRYAYPRKPAETARMLRLVEPPAADRLVDRFTRLVDGFLAGDPETGEEP